MIRSHEPGTGKTIIKEALVNLDPKRIITPVVNRTLHTYHNTVRILCQAFQIDFEGHDHYCERLLVEDSPMWPGIAFAISGPCEAHAESQC